MLIKAVIFYRYHSLDVSLRQFFYGSKILLAADFCDLFLQTYFFYCIFV